MRGNYYSSQAIKVANPFVPYGVTMLVAGGAAIALALLSVIEIQQTLKSLFASTVDESSGDYIMAMLAVGVVSGYWVLWGLKSAFVGVRSLGRLVVPPGTPPDFADYEVVSRTFTERTLFSREMPTKGPIALAYKYVSDKVPFLTPHLRGIVENSVSFARRMIAFVVVLTALYFLIDILPAEAMAELPLLAQPFPFLFIGILVVVALVKVGTLFGLMPPTAPSCETVEQLHGVRGGGDPVTMPQNVEKTLTAASEDGAPSRISKTGFQMSGGGVDNTGNFTGDLFIETQPMPVGHDRAASVYVLLLVGIMLTLFAVFLYTRVPAVDTPGIATLAWPFFQGFVYARIGTRLFQHAHMIMGSFRYESVIMYLHADGTFGRSEIKAGKGITDSFETSNTVVRSDANVKIYAASAITESYKLTGQRQIIAMAASPEARQTAEKVIESLREFQTEGVVVRGIDVASSSMDTVAKANLAYEDARRSISTSEPPPRLEADAPNLLVEGASDVEQGRSEHEQSNGMGTKTCPDCAESIKAEARKCRFCGYRFDEVVSD